jgi:hypothetical protein
MRLKISNAGARVCALASFFALSATALTPAPALALPEGRVYEQVSPEFKAGYPVLGETAAAALDGESFTFSSIGAFSGSGEDFGFNPYVSRRSGRGWVTSGLFPPANDVACAQGLEEMSPDLVRYEYRVDTGSTASACEASATSTVQVREPDGSFAPVSPTLTTVSGETGAFTVAGGRSDLSRTIIAVSSDSPPVHFVVAPPECGEGFLDERQMSSELFETEACGLRLVGLDEKGRQISLYCPVNLGGSGEAFGAVSQPNAAEVFFSVAINSRTYVPSPCLDETANPIQLFVRVNGKQTLTISAPLAADCSEEPCKAAMEADVLGKPKDAVFQGASEDGSRVFFTTTQPLVNGDKDAGNDLYMATVGCASGATGEACGLAPREVTSLVMVSEDPHLGQSADVAARVAAISPDGSHVYFVAGGDLLGAPEHEALELEGRPLPRVGAENLYAYEHDERYPSGHMAFVADLCSGPKLSGSVSDARCPGDLEAGRRDDSALWTFAGLHEAQTTPNGQFVVFTTYGQLITGGLERDADNARDVYRYDAKTARLQRVSISEGGVDANGNRYDEEIEIEGKKQIGTEADAKINPTQFLGSLQTQYELGSRAISEDGSTIVFMTSEPLSSAATNGQQDVYVWHEGRVAMISSGTAPEADHAVAITPSGRDIFFATTAGLLTADVDGLADIYDARVGGGYPPPPAAREPCSGDACQGPLSAPAPLLVSGSVTQPAGGNLPVPLVKAKSKSKTHKKRKTKSTKRRRARKRAHGTVTGRRGR